MEEQKEENIEEYMDHNEANMMEFEDKLEQIL